MLGDTVPAPRTVLVTAPDVAQHPEEKSQLHALEAEQIQTNDQFSLESRECHSKSSSGGLRVQPEQAKLQNCNGQNMNYMMPQQPQYGLGGLSSTPLVDPPRANVYGNGGLSFGYTEPPIIMSQSSQIMATSVNAPSADILTLQQQQQQIELLQQQIEILKLRNQAQSLSAQFDNNTSGISSSMNPEELSKLNRSSHPVLPPPGSSAEAVQQLHDMDAPWNRSSVHTYGERIFDDKVANATAGDHDDRNIARNTLNNSSGLNTHVRGRNNTAHVSHSPQNHNFELNNNPNQTKESKQRVLPPPGSVTDCNPQQKPVVSSWNKPKVWGPRERFVNDKNNDKNKNYGDPDQDENDFATKSDLQGKMLRNMNSEKGRAAMENELFGTDRHMTAGLDFDKYDDIPVEATGNGIPEPINSFAESKLCKALLDNIFRANYSRPTPIQKYAIPMGLSGRDVMACAQTGSGKTAAFLFPIIHTILSQTRGAPNNKGDSYNRGARFRGDGREITRRGATPVGIVLAPTRELASQIHDEALRFTYQTSARCVVLYGGAEVRAQVEELGRGCSIIIATPGRLEDLIDRERVSLRKINHLVLDEADRMLDMGFEPQIRKIVQGYDMPQGDLSEGGRQTSMFSATFPRDIQQLAGDFMANYIFVTVGRVGATASSIKQVPLWVEDSQKMTKLVELLTSNPGLTLVFVETKRLADTLHKNLYYHENVRCTSIHGDRSQRERERALWEFSTQRVDVLVATEVAARGLDVPNVSHVINYDLPSDIDSYVHRIGRTGRAGNKGLATSFMNEKNMSLAADLVRILEETQQEAPAWLCGMARQAEQGRGGGNNFGSHDIRRQHGMPSHSYNGANKDGYSGGKGKDARGGKGGRGGAAKRGGRGGDRKSAGKTKRVRGSSTAPQSSTDSW